jgi:hypothetical protein
MGEIGEALGRGKKFKVDGKDYEVMPATLGDLEELMEVFPKVVTGNVMLNFVQFTDDEPGAKQARIDALYLVLDKAFRGKVSREKLKTLRRDEVKPIIDFFLVGDMA